MLTSITVRNFKSFEIIEFELGKAVVLIGPNNSGKTTALQAFALWDIGIRQWNSKRKGKTSPDKRPGVTINRTDLISLPVPSANLLWRDLHVRNVERINGKQKTKNIRIEIIVDGITGGKNWSCGMEFDYANEQSFYCRPLRLTDDKHPERMPVPEEAASVKIAFLPAMSGLAAIEPKWEPGRINVLLGEGQTAQVLRNLCYQIIEQNEHWDELTKRMKTMFGVSLQEPQYIVSRGEITMGYKDRGISLDISSTGRGLQQTLLLLAHLYAHPGTVLLLDEPDAHLEILRQRQIYHVLTELAASQGSQIIAASHSEIILNEAADKDIVIAFVGKPHRIDNRGSQVLKSLSSIGFDDYYLAEKRGWVLYLEGSTDLSILKVLSEILEHPAVEYLERPFVHFVGNDQREVMTHFWGLKEAKDDLVGLALFDRMERELSDDLGAEGLVWRRREIENYICTEEILLAYARGEDGDDLFSRADSDHRETVMKAAIDEISHALKTLHKRDPWSPDTKVTDDFLDPLFDKYFEQLGTPNQLRKTNYYVLARLISKDGIDPEVGEKLDAIVGVAKEAKPRTGT